MKYWRKLCNLFRPFHRGWCVNCNHPREIHRIGLIEIGYPGLKCLGKKSFKIDDLCMCDNFEPHSNLTYLERVAEENGVI